MTGMTDAYQWHGRTMIGSDGEKIGKISEIYEDPETGKPEWATVNTGLFGTTSNFVPLAGATPEGEDVRATVTKSQVKDAPGVESDGELSEQEERRLFDHYGVAYTTAGSTTAQDAPRAGSSSSAGEQRSEGTGGPGQDVSGPNTDDAMTRSEEELRVGTQQREAGRARLHKYVVTEQVTQTVPVSHEEVRVEREPITEGNRDQALSGSTSPRRSTRSCSTRRSRWSKSAPLPRSGCASAHRPSPRIARSPRRFARSRSRAKEQKASRTTGGRAAPQRPTAIGRASVTFT